MANRLPTSLFSLYTMVLLGMMASACNKTVVSSLQKPQEQFQNTPTLPVSQLQIPISYRLTDLEAMVNNTLTNTIYEDKDYTDNNNDGLKLKATKRDQIKLGFKGQTLIYKVPLDLTISKKIGFTSADAEASLALQFETAIAIGANWALQTTTRLVSHEWIKKPVLKTSLVDIPVGPIADRALKSSKETIEKAIDDNLKKSVDIAGQAKALVNTLSQPMNLYNDPPLFLHLQPAGASLSLFSFDGVFIRTVVGIDCITEIGMKAKPPVNAPPLPMLKPNLNPNEGFQMFLNIGVDYEEAEALAQKYMKGQSFSSGKKTVTVNDIQLYGQGSKLGIQVNLVGSIKGNLFLTGTPKFDPVKNEVFMDALDFSLESRNFLTRSAAWLLKGTIVNQMEKSMRFPLEANLKTIKDLVSQQLSDYPLAYNFRLKGSVSDFALQQLSVRPEGLAILMKAAGKLRIEGK